MSASLDGYAALADNMSFGGVHVRHAIPILRIADVDKAWEFYRGFLSFELD